MKSLIVSSLAVLSSMVICGSGIAQTNEVQGQLSSKDFKFAKAAAQGGKLEVTLGQIAIQNAQDPAVHEFGTKMVQDHQVANQELAQIIAQKGGAVSDEPSWMEGRTISHLQGLNGADFDKAYIKDMVSDHKEDIKEFQKEADGGDDADLRNFASKTLPTLQEHLRMAQDAQAKLSSSAAK